MKKNAGITMLSLSVMIACMLILLAITYRTGNMYIKETKEKRVISIKTIIAQEVNRRYEDNLVGLGPKDKNGNAYYEGYELTNENFEQLVSNKMTYNRYFCFALNASAAENLGVKDAEKFLISSFNEEVTSGKFIAVVNYKTGEVEIIEYTQTIKDILN